jgi:hypothetical protein
LIFFGSAAGLRSMEIVCYYYISPVVNLKEGSCPCGSTRW